MKPACYVMLDMIFFSPITYVDKDGSVQPVHYIILDMDFGCSIAYEDKDG